MNDTLNSDLRRQQMLEKFNKFGTDAFNDHELLEVLLYFALPEGDTNSLAHRLMNHFGALHTVLEASPSQLQQVEGIDDDTAEYLSVVGLSLHHYEVDVARCAALDLRLSDPDRIAKYFVPRLAAQRAAVLSVAYIDNDCHIIHCDEYLSDSETCVPINRAAIMRNAVRCSAAGVVLAHNHPDGSVTPTADDIASTQDLSAALRLLDISLVEHCIVAKDQFYSMALSGEINPPEE